MFAKPSKPLALTELIPRRRPVGTTTVGGRVPRKCGTSLSGLDRKPEVPIRAPCSESARTAWSERIYLAGIYRLVEALTANNFQEPGTPLSS